MLHHRITIDIAAFSADRQALKRALGCVWDALRK
jgi:hypothetical protein